MAGIERPEVGFAPFGRPAQLAASMGPALACEEIFERPAERVSAAEPDEVEELVDEDARELGAGAVESDAALAKEGGGVNGAATVPQATERIAGGWSVR